MPLQKLSNLFLEQSKDLIWMIDPNFDLVYANTAYLDLMKNVTGTPKKLNESVFVEGFGEDYIEKWRAYYMQALLGEHFEIEEHFYNPQTNEVEYSQISFKPITGDDNEVVAVACQSKDSTQLVQIQTSSNKLMDASLDVFCTINEQGNFIYVSKAAHRHWGYRPEELYGLAFRSLILEEDLPKTDAVAAEVLSGLEIRTFINRYKRKDGTIAYNLWSARWDATAKLMYCVARDGKEHLEKEEIILNSEHRFKSLVQDGSDMISIINSKGIYEYTSPTTTSILGITPEEFEGKTIFDFIHPEDHEKALGYMNRIRTEKKVLVDPFRLRDSNGQWRWIETVLTNMLDNPAVNGIVSNSRDITETMNMFKEIEVNEQFSKTVLESSPDCLKILDNEGQIIFMNFNGLCQMEIDDFSVLKNKKWWLLWGAENENLVKESVDKALLGEIVHFTAFCPTAKGTPKWWDVTVSPVSKLGEPIQKIISISRDITSKKEEEQRLKLLESVVINTKDAVLITEAEPFDEPGPRILFVNEAFTKMTGYTAEEVIGKTPRILQGPNSDYKELAKLNKALRNWETCEITTINYKKNGEEFWINFTVSPVANEEGWFTHWVAIERDVTEQKNKELENQLIAQISSNFNLENDFEKATKELCKAIGLYGKVDWVELWTTNLEKTAMHLKNYYLSTPEDEVIYASESNINSFSKDEGLIGKVWSTGSNILCEDVLHAREFVRKEAAEKISIKSVLGIPLLFDSEVLGVLAIGVKSSSAYLKNYMNIFQRLERFIGSELRRKTLEIELSHLIDTIPDIISVGDFQGKFLRINKAGCELLGYTEEEILQQGFEKFFHPEDLTICYNELQQLQNGQDIFGFEARFRTKSGEILWLSWYCKAKINEGLIYCTAKNITEEKKLRELNRQSRKLAKIGSWEVHLLNQTVYWSDEVHIMHETDVTSFKPTMEQAIEFYREDFRELVNLSIENSINTGEPFDFEAVLVTANKKEVWVRAIGNAAFIDGNCSSLYGSFQDINDRKETEIRLQSLADNLPGVIFQYYLFADGTDSLRYVSKGSKEIWGFTVEEVLENNKLVWNQIAAGGQIEQVQKSITSAIESKKNWNAKWKYILPTGEERTHLGLGTPHFLSDGTIMFDSVILDISQEVKNEELLDEVSKIAKIGTWEADLINGINFKSPMVDEILELEPHHTIPNMEVAIEFVRIDYREQMRTLYTESITLGKALDFEAVIITANKNEKWVRIIGSPKIHEGFCVKIIGSIQDINEKKIAEEHRNSLLATLEKSLNEIYIFDAESFKFNYVNKGALLNLGYSEDEINELTPMDIKPEYNATSFKQLVSPLKTKGNNKLILFTNHQRKDGTLYPVEAHLQYIEQGNNKSFLAVILDITERKKAEEQLLNVYQERNNILESIGDAFFAVDTNWTITYWNKEAEKILGKKRIDIIGENLWEKYADAIDLEFYKQYHIAMETGESVYFEAYYPTLNKWFEVSVYPSKEGLSVYFKDVTQRKEADMQLIKANERFEKVTHATSDAIWDWDILNDTYYRSQNIQKFFGKSTSTDLNSANFWSDAFHKNDIEEVKSSLSDALQNPEINRWEVEYRIINESNSIIYVIDRGLIIRDDNGKAIRMIGAMSDITSSKVQEQELLVLNESLQTYAKELERSNEELEQFAFITSHDLQEPLRMISSFMDQLKRKYGDQLDEKALQYIHFATDGAKRMKLIILDLLEYSRAGRITDSMEPVDLNEILSDFNQLRRKIISEKSVTISASGLPVVFSYKAAITQILHSLLDNAIKYSKIAVNPEIQISVEDRKNEWEFAIKDNGIGIESQFYDKIFIIFQRLHNRTEYTGTGIGLSIAKKHVEILGGKIWLESNINEGTIFYFTIPKLN